MLVVQTRKEMQGVSHAMDARFSAAVRKLRGRFPRKDNGGKMKCDELKDYDIMDIEAIDDERIKASSNGTVVPVTRVYIKAEVDAAITELKAENENIKDAFGGTTIAYNQVCDEYEQCDKGLRTTKRALWVARAYIMTLLNRDFQRLAYQCNNGDYKRNLLRRRNRYYDLSEKCLKKAEEYK